MATQPITSGHFSVVADTAMTLIAESGNLIVNCALSYHTRDPFAVRVVFSIPGCSAVEWVFARDLLVGGLMGPAGTGDVQLYPSAAGLMFELNSPGGRARLLADRDAITGFARRMVSAVAPGEEDMFYDIDREIALLADCQFPGSAAR